jgi:hypothetical protein
MGFFPLLDAITNIRSGNIKKISQNRVQTPELMNNHMKIHKEMGIYLMLKL